MFSLLIYAEISEPVITPALKRHVKKKNAVHMSEKQAFRDQNNLKSPPDLPQVKNLKVMCHFKYEIKPYHDIFQTPAVLMFQ